MKNNCIVSKSYSYYRRTTSHYSFYNSLTCSCPPCPPLICVSRGSNTSISSSGREHVIPIN
ncbi:hypothetical protein TYRP_001727 [Tyrophagus putrescentiae]|nr:hypothetical protein TYRP_001727 [Tyrophagus putrescentiae]